MGLIRKSHTMVATQLLISLCVAGLTSAASRPANQQVIVSDVVSALQPSIARAVAEALRSVGGNGFSTGSSSSSTGFASGSRFSGSSSGSASRFSGASSGSAAAFSTGSAVASGTTEEVTTKPEYNYQYQVSDDVDQTYITHNEARDGDDVTGTYSYVDSNGDLITVNYQAGIGGYTQTLEKQVGAVEIRARPAKAQPVQSVQSVQSNQVANRFQSAGKQQVNRSSSSSSSATVDQSALIRQILSVLQPQISVAVNSAVSNL